MTTITRKRVEITRKRNRLAIKAAERRDGELQSALKRSHVVTEAALKALQRAGYGRR